MVTGNETTLKTPTPEPPEVKAVRHAGMPFFSCACPACGHGLNTQTLGMQTCAECGKRFVVSRREEAW